jgi:WD40 repeat protein
MRYSLNAVGGRMCFSANSTKLAAVERDGVKVWDVVNGKEQATLRDSRNVASVVFSPDGKTLVIEVAGEAAQLWDVETRQMRATLQNFRGSTVSTGGVVYSPDGKTIATASLNDEGEHGHVPRLWDAQTGELIAEFLGEDTRPNCLAFSADGKWLAVGEWWPRIKLYDVVVRRERVTLDYWCMVTNVAFWPDGKTLTTTSGIGRPGNLREAVLWDLTTAKKLRTFRPDREKVPGSDFTAQALSQDGKLWATGCADNTVRLWKLD